MHNIELKLEKILKFLIVIIPFAICTGRAGGDIVTTTIACLFLTKALITRDHSYLCEPWIKFALVLWCYGIMRSFFSADLVSAMSKSLPWIRFIFFAVAISSILSKHPSSIKKLLITTSIAAVFLALDSNIQYILGHDIFGKPYFDHKTFIRLTGPFSKMVVGYIITSLSLPLVGVLAYYFDWKKGNKLKSMVILLSILFLFYTVFITGERSAFIQMTIGIFIILIAVRFDRSLILRLVSIMLGLTTIMYLFNPKIFYRQFITISEIISNFDQSPYGFLWHSGIKQGLDNLVLGVGPNQFESTCLISSGLIEFCRSHAHNIFIEWFAEFGLIGLTLFLSFLLAMLLDIKKFYLLINNKFYKYLAIGITSAFLVKLLPLPSSGFFKNWYGVPFWFLVGWIMSFKKVNTSFEQFKH